MQSENMVFKSSEMFVDYQALIKEIEKKKESLGALQDILRAKDNTSFDQLERSTIGEGLGSIDQRDSFFNENKTQSRQSF